MIPIRDENPTSTFPYVTIFLIALNTFIYFFPINIPTRVYTYYKYGVIPALMVTQGNEERYQETWDEMKQEVMRNRPSPAFKSLRQFVSEIAQWKLTKDAIARLDEDGDLKARFELLTLLSALFFHGGFMHFFVNMLFLWIFGNNIEDATGHGKFLLFYFLCGILASIVHIAIFSGSGVPTIGASGAISGVLGAYLLLYPRAEILTLIPIPPFLYPLDLPAYIFLLYWVFVQFISGLPSLGRIGGGVAWFAHIGGFFVGIALIALFKKKGIKFFKQP